MAKLSLITAWIPFSACVLLAVTLNHGGGADALGALKAQPAFRVALLAAFGAGVVANAAYTWRFATNRSLVAALLVGLGTLTCPCWPVWVGLCLVLPTQR